MTSKQEVKHRPIHIEIAAFIQSISRKELLALLGYKHVTEALIARIENMIGDKWLGLDFGGYDLKYSDKELALSLAKLAGIDQDLIRKEVLRIEVEIKKQKDRFHPVLFADTGFKRSSEPVVLLSYLSHLRYVACPNSLSGLPINQQVKEAARLSVQHYKDNPDGIELWGQIQRYVFTYGQGLAVAINVAGEVTGEITRFQSPTAALSIGGDSLAPATKFIQAENSG